MRARMETTSAARRRAARPSATADITTLLLSVSGGVDSDQTHFLHFYTLQILRMKSAPPKAFCLQASPLDNTLTSQPAGKVNTVAT